MRRVIFIALILLLVAVSFQRCSRLREMVSGPGSSRQVTLAEGPRLNLQDVQVISALNSEYTKLVDTVMPSVVAITTLARVRVPAMDPYNYFFGRRARTVERTRSGLGSGVIVSKEGHIMTNYHVIEGMDEIRVQLNDGRIEPAEVVGVDPRVDIAVLRAPIGNLAPLPFGDSDAINVGQIVFAVGNPFGLAETVTQGIISAKGRAISDAGPELLQTDAAVNPGNSGGPLLNLQGEIIGINSAIYSQTGSWAGISFAIPSLTAKRTLERILEKRPLTTQGYLGIIMMDINRSLARQLGLNDTRGVLVAEVIGGSPAERAGLQNGDVIVKMNGRTLNNPRDLRRMLDDLEAGNAVELVVLRDGQQQTFKAQLGEMPEDMSSARVPQAPVPGHPPQSQNRAPSPGRSPATPKLDPRNVLAGIKVAEIPPQLRARLPEGAQDGVVVAELEPGAPAAQRLQVGDIIQEVNQHPVSSVEEFYEAAGSVPAQDERALLFVARGNERSFVVITP